MLLEELRPRKHDILAALNGEMVLGSQDRDRDLLGGMVALDMMGL